MHQALKQVSLRKFNTFGVDAVADNFVEVTSNQEFKETIAWGRDKNLQPFILGGGSNVLFTNSSIPFVIVNRISGIKKINENDEFVWVESGAGEIWHDLVQFCIENGWGGVENLSLIPGTVGAAPMQNIGAYGTEVKEVFDSLEAIDLTTLESKKFDNVACQFGYRESVFKKEAKGKYFITSVVLKLTKSHQVNTGYGAIREVLESKGISNPTIKEVGDAVVQIRQSKLPDPEEIGNAGSFFKNPIINLFEFENLKKMHSNIPNYPQADGRIKVPAGWLIEQCGWKGMKEGAIGVHKNQALVLVNYGGGQGDEIIELAQRIQRSVLDKFNINIHPEVNIL